MAYKLTVEVNYLVIEDTISGIVQEFPSKEVVFEGDSSEGTVSIFLRINGEDVYKTIVPPNTIYSDIIDPNDIAYVSYKSLTGFLYSNTGN
jgi:hypothetical protein